jgi:hypothetical protein
MTEAELARLRSPIGLDLGARTPEETAISIAAELIQLRWGGTGQALTTTDGRIHQETADATVALAPRCLGRNSLAFPEPVSFLLLLTTFFAFLSLPTTLMPAFNRFV